MSATRDLSFLDLNHLCPLLSCKICLCRIGITASGALSKCSPILETKKLAKQLNNVDLLDNDHKFSEKDPLMVLDLLFGLMEECDRLERTEEQVYVKIPHFCRGDASMPFRTAQNRAHHGVVTSWPKAV